MRASHAALSAAIAAAVPPGSTVREHGSILDRTSMDGWSDLDVFVHLAAPIPVTVLIGDEPWAFEDTTLNDGSQRLRTVLPDGRRVDAVVTGHRVSVSEPADDNDIRFSAAIAAVRFGRHNTVMGLQRLLPVVEACLAESVNAAARDAGTSHQRFGGPLDVRADELLSILGSVPDPYVVVAVCELYGQGRSERDPSYRPDWSGLEAVLSRGTSTP